MGARPAAFGEIMNITTIGRGNIGGGLARLWERAGHSVTTLGREGGDASNADVVLVALPSGSISEGLGKVKGLEGRVVFLADPLVGLPERVDVRIERDETGARGYFRVTPQEGPRARTVVATTRPVIPRPPRTSTLASTAVPPRQSEIP